jgi:hypothetical protein
MRRAASVLVGVDAQEIIASPIIGFFSPTGFFADEAVSV